MNLSCHADDTDPLGAECVRTFPSTIFPASALLKREEIETGKCAGKSIIEAVHHGSAGGRKAYTEAPFDIMYGFRPTKYNVDLLSPFEMIRYWAMARVLPPALDVVDSTSEWTTEGATYLAKCKKL